MDWILDHLQIIIAIAGAIAYWLNARKKEQAGEPADYDGDGKPDVYPQPGRSMREHADTLEQEENTRRIQEEIRRKIAERQTGGSRMPPPLSPVPRAGPSSWDEAQARRREEAAEARRAEAESRREEAAQETTVVLARQRALAEQLAALQAKRAEVDRESRAIWAQQAGAAPAVSAGLRDDAGLLGELRSARSLRRAIVLCEVLGTPVGLQ